MKQAFELKLQGQDWSRLYYWYWGPILLLLMLNWLTPSPLPVPGQAEVNFGALGLTIAISFLTMLVESFFAVPILRTWLPTLSIGGKAFGFAGDANDYMVLNVKGFLLSVVTVGLYLPWYARDVMVYLAKETTFDGATPEFTGEAGRLLRSFLAALGFAILAVTLIVIGLAVSQITLAADSVLLATAVTVLAVLLALGPILYVYYAWAVQFRWQNLNLRWTTKASSASTVIIGQFFLTVVSLGIWWPGATLILYRYFVARTVLEDGSGVQVRFVFEGNIGEGFKVLWVQALLTLVTLGFYGAWSGPNVGRWLAERTFAVPNERPSLVV